MKKAHMHVTSKMHTYALVASYSNYQMFKMQKYTKIAHQFITPDMLKWKCLGMLKVHYTTWIYITRYKELTFINSM